MGLSYFKRFRMEIDLVRRPPGQPWLPPPYVWVAWQPSLIALHAAVKHESFRDELDSAVFPCLGNQPGCQRLMQEIVSKPGFLPEATWLIAYPSTESGPYLYCGTIQGVLEPGLVGSIQNVGVVPEHRRRGLGRALLLKALGAFREAGASRVALEVTAKNAAAVRLYRSVGFRKWRTVYKAVEVEPVGQWAGQPAG